MGLPRFLMPAEVQLLKADFASLLTSSESSILRFNYNVGVGSPTLDPTYRTTDYSGGLTTVQVSGYGLQKIVKHRDEQMLKFGILEIGDCIFYFSNDIDLSQGIPTSLEVIDPGDVAWTPVPRTLHQFYDYLGYRIGNTQLCQWLPCKVKK